MDTHGIDRAILAGFDWGAWSADVVAALWPDRCRALVSVSRYLISSQAASQPPLPPQAELAWWYQFYFATDCGQAGYAVVIHNYRWRLGLAAGESQYDDLERRLAAFPDITVPTITLEGDANGAPHPTPAPTSASSPASTSTASLRAASGTTCRKGLRGLSPPPSPTSTATDQAIPERACLRPSSTLAST
jgi:pimeloyl-ACP methyl ester carboxylesterase